MRLLLAYRFLRSKSNSSFINIISKISVLGIILGISILITVINIDIPRMIPKTDIFDIIFMKLELLFDRKNLYANNNRIKILYHRC